MIKLEILNHSDVVRDYAELGSQYYIKNQNNMFKK